MVPGHSYRYTLRQGLIGHDVWALQLNLNHFGDNKVIADGVFGPGTATKVKKFQKNRNLIADGIAGAKTQITMADALARPFVSKYALPQGLLYGVVEGESGFMVGAVNWLVPGGVDCGWTQRRVSTTSGSEDRYRQAFDGPTQFQLLARALREKKDQYITKPFSITEKRAWELAVLYHNWPYAADNLARRGYIYNDRADDTKEAQWVINIGVQGVRTPIQWANYYIASKTIYVHSWPR